MAQLRKQDEDHQELESELMQLKRNIQTMIPSTSTLGHILIIGKSYKDKEALSTPTQTQIHIRYRNRIIIVEMFQLSYKKTKVLLIFIREEGRDP